VGFGVDPLLVVKGTKEIVSHGMETWYPEEETRGVGVGASESVDVTDVICGCL
jgi:hypothetical protein